MTDNHYYDILGISREATISDVKKKYRELVLKFHPDKVEDDKKEEAERKFKEISEAYTILSNPEKRKIYDERGRDGLNQQHMGPNADEINAMFANIFKHNHAFNNIFGNMFGGGPHFGNQHQQQSDIINLDEIIDLKDVFTGKKVKKDISRKNICVPCEGTGFVDKNDHKCSKCKGVGTIKHVDQINANFFKQYFGNCDVCQGSGFDNNQIPKCEECKGKKFVYENFTLEFEIQPGAAMNDQIRFEKVGNEFIDSTTSEKLRSDVVITINEHPDPVFKRYINFGNNIDPSNLLIELEISLAESLCGFKRKMPHIAPGEGITIVESDIIKQDDIRFIENKGAPIKNSKARGKLFIKYNVTYPSKLKNMTKSKIFEALTGKKYDHSYTSNTKNVEDYVKKVENETEHNGNEDDTVQECNNQ